MTRSEVDLIVADIRAELRSQDSILVRTRFNAHVEPSEYDKFVMALTRYHELTAEDEKIHRSVVSFVVGLDEVVYGALVNAAGEDRARLSELHARVGNLMYTILS